MFFSTIQPTQKVKLKAGDRMIPVEITKEGDRLFFKFAFNKPLMAEIKMMEGHRWHGHDERNPRKVWSVRDCDRNRFQLSYLACPAKGDPNNPYYFYDIPLLQDLPRRGLLGDGGIFRSHQLDMFRHGITRQYCEIAAEMGTGKTLASIEIIEWAAHHFGSDDWIFVAPRSALVSVKLEFVKWSSRIQPKFVTYEGLKKLIAEWPAGKDAPHGVVFDEASRLKNPAAQRTVSARYLADQIRAKWGRKGFVIEMTGTPGPKSPADWWSQAEIACPGFLKEGSLEKFKNTLAIIEQREAFAGGGSYPHLVSWRDDEKKCSICGLERDAETHSTGIDVFEQTQHNHEFVPSVNEVARLYRRLNGLVMVKLKKDCLDLPEKQYREIELKPSRSVLNAACAIQAKAKSGVVALTLLRELSDGFQYVETEQGSEVCPLCKGTKTCDEQYDENHPENHIDPQEFAEGCYITVHEDGTFERGEALKIGVRQVACHHCDATGEVARFIREAKQIPTPKEDALKDIIDQHDEVGRLVVYAGFTGSIDRVAMIVKALQWEVIRVDGRGWVTTMPYKKPEEMVRAFQDKSRKHPRIVFLGHPGSAGMGLTLTESPTICYWSNDFNAESRIQSEDRIHRMGMDVNRGATIIDLIHLPSDRLVINNLKKKRKLQDMTMGELSTIMEQALLEV